MGSFPETIALIVGGCLVVFLLLQLTLVLYTSLRQMRSQSIYQGYAYEEWQNRVKAAEKRVEQVEATQEHWSGWRKFEVRKKQIENEAADICSFYLYPHDRRQLPPFNPGQFLMVRADIPDPDDSFSTLEESRCYSLSDSFNPRYYRVSIKRVPPPRENPDNYPAGIVSNFFHDHVKEGDLIDVMAPSGDFFLDTESADPAVLIAAGVGITPIISMVNAIVDRKLNRETWMFYGVRGAQELALTQAVRYAVDHVKDLHVVFCYSDGKPDTVEDVHGAEGSSLSHVDGRVSVDLFKELLPSNNFGYYMCGPPPMLLGTRDALLEWKVPRADIHYELFVPTDEDDDEDEAPVAPSGQSFRVRFAASDKELNWSGEKNILGLTKQNKLKVKRIRYTCKQGKCGSCHTAIRSGTVAYPGTQPTFDVQDGYCLPCIGVPASDLELEA